LVGICNTATTLSRDHLLGIVGARIRARVDDRVDDTAATDSRSDLAWIIGTFVRAVERAVAVCIDVREPAAARSFGQLVRIKRTGFETIFGPVEVCIHKTGSAAARANIDFALGARWAPADTAAFGT